MRKLIILLAFLSCFVVKAQSDTVHYVLVSNNPNYSYFGAGLNYDLSINSYNFTLAALGVNARYFSDNFDFKLKTRYHIADKMAVVTGVKPIHQSIYKPSHSLDYTFDATYYFSKRNLKNEAAVILKKTGNVHYYSFVDVKSSYRWGVDLGLSTGSTFFNFGDEEIINLDYIDANGANVGVDVKLPITSYFDYTFMKVGINKTEIEGFKINTDRFGMKKTYSMTQKYLHLLVLADSSLDDIYFKHESFGSIPEYYELVEISDMKRSQFGLAIGYEYYVIGERIDAGWSAELGVNPGPKTKIKQRSYLTISVEFNLGKMF